MKNGKKWVHFTIAMLLLVTRFAYAGIVGNIATETTQILNNAQLVAQFIRQGEQLSQEIRQLSEMVRNGRPLPIRAVMSA